MSASHLNLSNLNTVTATEEAEGTIRRTNMTKTSSFQTVRTGQRDHTTEEEWVMQTRTAALNGKTDGNEDKRGKWEDSP